MAASEEKKLQECLTELSEGLRNEINRTTHLESTLSTLQTKLNTLEVNFTDKITTISTANERKFQQLEHSVKHLDTQLHDFHQSVSKQISELTKELRTTLATLRTSPSRPSTPPPPNQTSTSHPSLTPSSPQDPNHILAPRPTIIIQPPTNAPSFSGKSTERPRPFLLQLHQYTNSSFGWDTEILLQNVGQFLKDNALEWYTQIITSHHPPLTWDVFQNLFLQQFSSPLRVAQIEHQWNRCIQKSDEPINDFLIRLRSLWSEHKPEETERDLVRHLLTKIRPPLLPLIGVLPDHNLDNFLIRAREAELIDFTRSKHNFHTNTPDSSNPPSRSSYPSTNRSHIVCYKCNIPGHLAPQCTNSVPTANTSRSKN